MERYYCNCCKRQTNHQVLGEGVNEYQDDVDYNWARYTYRIVKCLGCDNVSFNLEKTGSEYVRVNGITGDEEQYSEFISYPDKEGMIEPIRSWDIPHIVSRVYMESVKALSEDCNILATIGFRATIEAICLDKNIEGSLKTKIDRMKSQGIITKEDCRRLHELRINGNDSAHEMKSLSKEQLLVVYEVINGVLLSLYVLDKKFKDTFFYRFDSVDAFINLINEGIKHYSIGCSYVLRAYLPMEYKYRKEDIERYESELVQRINDGSYSKLALDGTPEDGKKQQFKLLTY